jgi:phosphatidylserine synthase
MDERQMRFRANLADGLSVGNGASGVAGVIVLLAWHDPRALPIACLFVFVAWGFDSIDGLAARGVKRAPAQGIVLDSLCDTSSFGALPAALLVAYGMAGGRATLAVAIVTAFTFYACVILRLRRYTVDALGHAAGTRTSFAGVPSPVAAMSVAAAILTAMAGPHAIGWLPTAFALGVSPLMLSRIPYQETPKVAVWMVRAKWPLPLLAIVGYLAGHAAVAVSVFFAAYIASGLFRRARVETGAAVS